MRLRFTIRDLLWLAVSVVLAVGWWIDQSKLAAERKQLKEQIFQQTMEKVDSMDLPESKPLGLMDNPANRATGNLVTVDELTAILNRRLPIGSSRTEANNLMTAEGFTCDFEQRGTFRYKVVGRDGSTTKQAIENADFLRCHRQSNDGFVTTVMIVAVLIENDAVAKIIVDREFIGP